MAQSRGVIREAFKSFINSLRPKKYWGVQVGQDYKGTTYFEIPTDINEGMRKRTRWFVPPPGSDFEHEVPSEWMAWLMHRRRNPPTDEEIQINLLNMKRTIEAAKALQEGASKSTPTKSETAEPNVFEKIAYPTYLDYERNPGEIKKP